MKNIKILFMVLCLLCSFNFTFAGGPEPMLISAGEDYASFPVNSPDGSSFAFVTYEGEKAKVFLNGKVVGTYDGVDEYSIIFDYNNKLYFKAKINSKWFVFIDGKNQNEYDEIFGINMNSYGSDSNYLYSYVGFKNSKYYLIYNGVESSVGYNYMEDYPNLNFDDSVIIYVAKDNDGELFIVNGVPLSKRFDDIGYTVFSPNGKIFISTNYTLDGKTSVIINGSKEIGKYEDIGGIIFSPDGKKLYYSIMKNDKYYFVLNGKIINKEYETIDYYDYTYEGGKFFFQMVGNGGKKYIIVNGKAQKKYDEVGYPIFSPDEKKYVYFAREGEKWVVVVNGVELK